jgi:hypothetical protein
MTTPLVDILQGLKRNTFAWAKLWVLNGAPDEFYPYRMVACALASTAGARRSWIWLGRAGSSRRAARHSTSTTSSTRAAGSWCGQTIFRTFHVTQSSARLRTLVNVVCNAGLKPKRFILGQAVAHRREGPMSKRQPPWPVPIGHSSTGKAHFPDKDDWRRFNEEQLQRDRDAEPGREQARPGRKFPVQHDE